MSARRSKKNSQRFNMYVNGEVDTLKLKESKGFCFRGVMLIIGGLFFFLLCLVFGQFDDVGNSNNRDRDRMMGPGSATSDDDYRSKYSKYASSSSKSMSNGRW